MNMHSRLYPSYQKLSESSFVFYFYDVSDSIKKAGKEELN